MVALFYTHQQGATHRGARRQEPLVSRLPTAALSDVASVDKAIPPYARAPPPYTSGAIHASSPHTPARLSPYAGAVPPHVSTAPTAPYACADPHRFSWLPTRFHGFPMQPPSSKNPDIGFNETSVSGAVPHVRTGHQSAETSDRLAQTYASNRFSADSLRQRRGGKRQGMASPRDAAPTSQWGPAFKPA